MRPEVNGGKATSTGEPATLQARLQQAERRLREVEERYALATSAALEGIYEWDLIAGQLLLTDRAKEFFGLVGNDLTPSAWNARIHTDDYLGYRAAIVNHFKGRTPRLEHEYRIVDAEGGYGWILDRGVGVRDANGRVTKVVGALSDITRRKLAEIELRHARDQAEEALEQQTAMSEVLRVMSRSPTNAQPVFELVAQRAGKLCHAEVAVVSRFDGKVIELAAIHGVVPEAVKIVRSLYPLPIDAETVTSRAIRGSAVVHVADVLADPSYAIKDFALAAHFRAGLGVPIVRDGQVFGSIFVGRATPGLFTDSQVELLKAFADQAAIAIEDVRLFNETEEALEQQTATSDILRVISQSPTDVQPVFDAIAERAAMLCGAKFAWVTTFDGEWIHMRATHGPGAEGHRAHYPIRPGSDSVGARVIQRHAAVQIPDFFADAEYALKEAAEKIGIRSGFGAPMMRDGQVLGAIALAWPEPGVVPDKLVRLLQTFADQAVIAIENVRLFKELEARNRDLTATSEILRVISTSPTNVHPVFDAIVKNAVRLCEARFGAVFRLDGGLVHLAAHHNFSETLLTRFQTMYPMAPNRGHVSGRTILTGAAVQVPDILADEEYLGTGMKAAGFRSLLGVPLLRGGRTVGAIVIYRTEPGQFADKHIELLQTFADQAVIAIENVRLFNETKEALEQQTATSDILKVISSSPTNVQPVFDAIVNSAARLFEPCKAVLTMCEGDLLRRKAIAGPRGSEIDIGEFDRLYPLPLDPDRSMGTRAIVERRTIQIPDTEAPEVTDLARRVGRAAKHRSVTLVPLLREGEGIGTIMLNHPAPGFKLSEKQLELVRTFADQAVIAIENVRLFKELEARTTELTKSVGELKALGEVGQAVSSTLDLETVLSTIVSRAAQLAGMDGGSIWEYDEAREEFYLHATDRLPDELVEALRASPIRKGEGALGRLAMTGEPVEIRDIADERSYQSRLRETLIRCGYRSVLAVPLLREEHLLGALAVNRTKPGEFAPEIVALLKTFATQSALAIQNARLYREIEVKSRELEAASRHKSEFLANMSHELRTPLNAIIGFSEVLSERMFGEINEKQAEYLADILESGRHLLSLINDILDLSKIEAGRMELELNDFNLPVAIDNTLTLVRERAQRRSITLTRSVDERLGMVRADERKVKQVLLNLLSNALKFTPEGGQIDVRAAVNDGAAEVSVRDTGVGIAPEDQEIVFEEFRQVGTASKKVEGTGLGLAISRKFIELHGGRIWVESQVGKGSTFAFTLPLTIDQRHQTG